MVIHNNKINLLCTLLKKDTYHVGNCCAAVIYPRQSSTSCTFRDDFFAKVLPFSCNLSHSQNSLTITSLLTMTWYLKFILSYKLLLLYFNKHLFSACFSVYTFPRVWEFISCKLMCSDSNCQMHHHCNIKTHLQSAHIHHVKHGRAYKQHKKVIVYRWFVVLEKGVHYDPGSLVNQLLGRYLDISVTFTFHS